jgi:hypothetical protein
VRQRRVLYLQVYEGGRWVERRPVAVVAAEAPERSEREFRTAGEIANALLGDLGKPHVARRRS